MLTGVTDAHSVKLAFPHKWEISYPSPPSHEKLALKEVICFSDNVLVFSKVTCKYRRMLNNPVEDVLFFLCWC